MIALVTNKLFMRSKFTNNAFLSFDLMIDLLATRTIMRSKCVIMLVWVSISLSKCRPPDRHCQILMNKFNLMNTLNFDLMKKWILISWNSTSWPWVKMSNLKFNNDTIRLPINVLNNMRNCLKLLLHFRDLTDLKFTFKL